MGRNGPGDLVGASVTVVHGEDGEQERLLRIIHQERDHISSTAAAGRTGRENSDLEMERVRESYITPSLTWWNTRSALTFAWAYSLFVGARFNHLSPNDYTWDLPFSGLPPLRPRGVGEGTRFELSESTISGSGGRAF